jgi:hypothetical protein
LKRIEHCKWEIALMRRYLQLAHILKCRRNIVSNYTV